MLLMFPQSEAAATTISPYGYPDPIFMSLMAHTCTITLAAEATATASSYGHQKKSYTPVPQDVYTDIACRFRPLTADEQTIIGRESETSRDWYLYVPRHLMPTSMRTHSAAARHQVSNVKTKRGELIEDGPLDVRSVREVAGEQNHFLVLVRKAS